MIPRYQSLLKAFSIKASGFVVHLLPQYGYANSRLSTAISAKRWLSLVSPGPAHAGEDDYFSSDFDDERLKGTFGKIGSTGTPMLILYSGSDAHVPESVDKQLLLDRWKRQIEDGGGVLVPESAVIPGASHTLRELGGPAEEVCKKVTNFLSRLQ